VTEETRTLVRYRLGRAREALEEAVLLLERGYTNTCVNRLYYACFYAVSALLLARGLSSARHSGIRALFHQHIVKPGMINVPLGQLYDRLFDNRQKGDYADLVRFAIDDVQPWVEEARTFVDVVAARILQGLEQSNP
jgi:uncharacterized protein (UPF0332 family)